MLAAVFHDAFDQLGACRNAVDQADYLARGHDAAVDFTGRECITAPAAASKLQPAGLRFAASAGMVYGIARPAGRIALFLPFDGLAGTPDLAGMLIQRRLHPVARTAD
jgi:hypothetical protein